MATIICRASRGTGRPYTERISPEHLIPRSPFLEPAPGKAPGKRARRISGIHQRGLRGPGLPGLADGEESTSASGAAVEGKPRGPCRGAGLRLFRSPSSAPAPSCVTLAAVGHVPQDRTEPPLPGRSFPQAVAVLVLQLGLLETFQSVMHSNRRPAIVKGVHHDRRRSDAWLRTTGRACRRPISRKAPTSSNSSNPLPMNLCP